MTSDLRALLRAHVGLPCPYCGRPMENPIRTHIRSVRYGGSLTDDNKVIVCTPCDNDKGHLTLKDWLRKLHRENDSREPIVKAFRAARKAAEAAKVAQVAPLQPASSWSSR
jgi:5-methylcytosine-specific restriction endonuclease McrA